MRLATQRGSDSYSASGLPSLSVPTAYQPWPGISVLSSVIVPPSDRTFSIAAEMSSTAM